MKSWTQDNITLYHGDCRELQVEGITAIVTDPPYGLNFIGVELEEESFNITVNRLKGVS